MKLALAVVYTVDAAHGGLLRLHLDRIARHTRAAPTVYAGVTRLLPQFRGLLDGRAGVRTFDLPETPLRGALEHSFYLEALIERAVADGATHVATAHVDSFPVTDGWDDTLAARLSASCPFAVIERIDTACLFFRTDFHRQYRPHMLVPDEEQAGPSWRAFLAETSSRTHSGVGYAWAAWQAGLRWHSMVPRRASGDAAVYDDLIFHLKGALRLSQDLAEQNNPLLRAIGREKFVRLASAGRSIRMKVRSVLSPSTRQAIRRLVPAAVDHRLSAPQRRWQAAEMTAALDRLLADPEGYLASMPRLHTLPDPRTPG